MAVRIIWSYRARKDLGKFGSYVRRDDPTAASSLIRGIEEKVESLVNFPELGHAIPGENVSSMRELIHRPYKIPYLYAREQNRIFIVRIWHAARGEPEL